MRSFANTSARAVVVHAGLLTNIGDEMLFEHIEDAAFAFENARAPASPALDVLRN
jgi:hypothetical protein